MKKFIILLSLILAGCANNEQMNTVIPTPTPPVNYEQKALDIYGNAAYTNDPVKINRLGVMYEYGFGVVQDKQKARLLYYRAATLGYGSGYYNLGLASLENGVAGYAMARDFFILASKSPMKNEIGHIGLGDAYLYGYGVKPDIYTAMSHYLKAIQLGDNSGYPEERLGDIEKSRNHYSEASSWYQRALEKGYRSNKTLKERMISILQL